MRKLIIVAAALAFVSSTSLAPSIAFAQGAATSTDTTKSDTTKMSKKKTTKSKKSAKKSGEDTMQKQ
ncbi:hypothetical protein [Bradyrhizobium sp. STM 3562]|uniref:hypothetical protein n=1 Tax=Bradyrhizobium sp. STM 3562 TaxID=578924 RepID=UPI003891054C